MKTLLSFLVITISFGSLAQDFNTKASTAKTYKANYISPLATGAITADHKLVHSRDEIEVIDLLTGKTTYSFDFEGAYGTTWISADGNYAANYSQNAKQIDKRWVNANHVLNLKTKKVYSYYSADDYWEKAAFGSKENEVLVAQNNLDKGTSLILYDYVSMKPINTYFNSTKFSTVIMNVAFSKSNNEIYAVIAENSLNSYFAVYGKDDGKLIKKIQLKYQADRIWVRDNFIFLSGADGNMGKPYTTKINADDYSVEATWNFRINNVDATGNYAVQGEYKTANMIKYDLSSGKKSVIGEMSNLPSFATALSSGFSPDGYYYFTEIKREGHIKDQAGKDAVMVFTNSTIDPSVVHDQVFVPEVDMAEEIVPDNQWVTFEEETPKFKVDFEGTAEKKAGETSKGSYTCTYKQVPSKDVVYMVVVTALSSKTKESKYAVIASKTAENFEKRYTPENSDTKEITIDGQRATELTFTKKNVLYRYRSVCINGYAFQLIYLNSEGKGNTGDEFFDSFTTK